MADLFSKAGIVNRDVPHSSILGPLLFLTYINDLPQLLSEYGSYLYADDTYIFYQDKGVHKIEDVVHKESSKLCEWFVDNRLSIHFGKEKKNAFSFLNLCALEHLVRHFDSNASGKSMAIKLSKKLNAKVKYLYRQN